jgi:hypothetical protein
MGKKTPAAKEWLEHTTANTKMDQSHTVDMQTTAVRQRTSLSRFQMVSVWLRQRLCFVVALLFGTPLSITVLVQVRGSASSVSEVWVTSVCFGRRLEVALKLLSSPAVMLRRQTPWKMGATGFIATQEEGWAKTNSRILDLIVSTVSNPDMPIAGYFSLLDTHGQFIQVSLPWRQLTLIDADDV